MSLYFICAFCLSFLTLLAVIYFTRKYNLFIDDSQNDKPQNFHQNSTPRAGGIGLITGMTMFFFSALGLKLILPILLAFSSGIFEDLHNSLSPKLRLFLQFIAAVSAVWLTDSVVTYLGLGITLPYSIGIVFSVFAIVGMMNAINIIDGFNGLSSGISLMILISYAIVAYAQNANDILTIINISIAATLGFIVLNFPKGKIFLGDGGAYLLGFILALVGIFLASKHEGVSPWYIASVLIYPVWEVLYSVYRRVKNKRSAFAPDASHMHTLIYKHITKSNPLTALLIVVVTSPFIIIPAFYAHSSIISMLSILIFILCYVLLYRYLVRKPL